MPLPISRLPISRDPSSCRRISFLYPGLFRLFSSGLLGGFGFVGVLVFLVAGESAGREEAESRQDGNLRLESTFHAESPVATL